MTETETDKDDLVARLRVALKGLQEIYSINNDDLLVARIAGDAFNAATAETALPDDIGKTDQ